MRRSSAEYNNVLFTSGGMIFRFENADENNDVTLGATSLGFRRAPGEDEIPYNLVRIP